MTNDSVWTQRRANSGDPSGLAGIGLGAPEDDRVQPMPFIHHVLRALEQRWVQELDQHPEPEVVALVRRGRKQQQVTCMAFERLGELVVLGLLAPGCPFASRSGGALRRTRPNPTSGASRRRFTRAGRFSVSMLAISRSCLAKAFDLRSVTSPSLPKTSKLRLNTSLSSRCQLFTRPAGTTIRARFSSPRLASSRRISAVSMVLPRPTSSAIRNRRGDARGDAMGQHDLMRQEVDLG